MIEAGSLNVALEEVQPMRDGRSGKQGEVAGIGENCAVQARVVGQRGHRAEPHFLTRLGIVEPAPARRIDGAQLDRLRAEHPTPAIRMVVRRARAQQQFAHRQQALRAGHFGHRLLVVDAFLGALE